MSAVFAVTLYINVHWIYSSLPQTTKLFGKLQGKLLQKSKSKVQDEEEEAICVCHLPQNLCRC